MSSYFIVTYDVANREEYKKYNPGSNHITGQTVAKHEGEIIAATTDSINLGGEERDMKVIIKFPNREAALAWNEDPEYAAAKTLRLASTKNIDAYIIDGLSEEK